MGPTYSKAEPQQRNVLERSTAVLFGKWTLECRGNCSYKASTKASAKGAISSYKYSGVFSSVSAIFNTDSIIGSVLGMFHYY